MPWVNSRGGAMPGSDMFVSPRNLTPARLEEAQRQGFRWVEPDPQRAQLSMAERRAEYAREWARADAVLDEERRIAAQARVTFSLNTGAYNGRQRTALALAVRYGQPVWANRSGDVLDLPDTPASERMARNRGYLPVPVSSESMTRAEVAAAWEQAHQRDVTRIRAERTRAENSTAAERMGITSPAPRPAAEPLRNNARELADLMRSVGTPPLRSVRDPATRCDADGNVVSENPRGRAAPARDPGDADDDTRPEDRTAQPNVAGGSDAVPLWTPNPDAIRSEFPWAGALTQLDRAARAVPLTRDVPMAQLPELARVQYEIAGLLRLVYERLARGS